ncbi:MAG: hypothetical protein ROZ09_15100 [Thiobacillus sp.]|uniref:hypothetical protein n=1 Tax=Thiobacillus sp. TaxID=924 RepID=UPI00289439C4|nr:hypothetical protein [Thiobacillus sp.]MDT3708148.1 hypothetical protein [Thiobacillus sp.]
MDQTDSGMPRQDADGKGMTITVRADATELQALLSELGEALEAAPLHVRKLAFDLFDHASELVCVQDGVTEGAGITVLLEPSQLLRDLVAAMRAGDLEGLAIQRSH